MPRCARLEIADGIHHVVSRGNRHQAIFVDDHDRQLFLEELERAVVRQGWHCLAYCLMDNHFHLVLQTPEPNLGVGMRNFLSRFAQRCNERHGIDGHMFKERYRPVPVTSDRHFACALRYLALNPVNAGLCDEPGQWHWSSHASTLAGSQRPLVDAHRVEELLECWGGAYGTRYATLMSPESPFGSWSDAVSPSPPRPAIRELLESLSLDEAMASARHEYAYRLREIAAEVGLSEATVSRRTRR